MSNQSNKEEPRPEDQGMSSENPFEEGANTEPPKPSSENLGPEKVDKPEEEQVSVPRSLLETLQNDIKHLKKNEGMLMQIADKKQLALYYSRNQKELPPVVKLRMIENKVILGWRTIQDEVFEDSVTGRWKEIQILQVILEDGTKKELSFRDYTRKYTHVEAKVLSTTNNSDGGVVLKVERKDNNKVYEIGVQYIN